MRRRWVWRDGKIVEVSPDRVGSATIHVIGDNMDMLKSDITGEYFTSKSKFERHVRDHGSVIIGTEKDKKYFEMNKNFPKLDVKGALERADRRLKYNNDR
jgi:hypothetical protein